METEWKTYKKWNVGYQSKVGSVGRLVGDSVCLIVWNKGIGTSTTK